MNDHRLPMPRSEFGLRFGLYVGDAGLKNWMTDWRHSWEALRYKIAADYLRTIQDSDTPDQPDQPPTHSSSWNGSSKESR